MATRCHGRNMEITPRYADDASFENGEDSYRKKTQAGHPACVSATPMPFDQGIGQPQPRWHSRARDEQVA